MDGTCNGYQHLSAMGRDPIGGGATNLIPGNEPADVYQQVADRAELRIRQDAEGDGPNADIARQLLGKIDRDGAKHATMTTPYGVTRGTIAKQLLEAEPVMHCKDPKKCAKYLAQVLEECIREVAVEAGRIMKCLRDAAGAIARENRGMVWTTPVGFRVVHESRSRRKCESLQWIARSWCTRKMKNGGSHGGSRWMASSPTWFIPWMPHT